MTDLAEKTDDFVPVTEAEQNPAYRAKIRKLIESINAKVAATPLGEECFVQIPIEAIFGYREGETLDFAAYEKIGFRHPKDANYYIRENADPEFMRIHDMISKKKVIDTPLLVWIYDDRILALDGATRTTIAAYIRGDERKRMGEPLSLRLVHVRVLRGHEDDAREEMHAQNLPGRQRSLRWAELADQIFHYMKQSIQVQRILDLLDMENTEKNRRKVKDIGKLREKACPELMELWSKGTITFSYALDVVEGYPKHSLQKQFLKTHVLNSKAPRKGPLNSGHFNTMKKKDITDAIREFMRLERGLERLKSVAESGGYDIPPTILKALEANMREFQQWLRMKAEESDRKADAELEMDAELGDDTFAPVIDFDESVDGSPRASSHMLKALSNMSNDSPKVTSPVVAAKPSSSELVHVRCAVTDITKTEAKKIIAAWHEAHGVRSVTAKDIIAACEEAGVPLEKFDDDNPKVRATKFSQTLRFLQLNDLVGDSSALMIADFGKMANGTALYGLKKRGDYQDAPAAKPVVVKPSPRSDGNQALTEEEAVELLDLWHSELGEDAVGARSVLDLCDSKNLVQSHLDGNGDRARGYLMNKVITTIITENLGGSDGYKIKAGQNSRAAEFQLSKE